MVATNPPKLTGKIEAKN